MTLAQGEGLFLPGEMIIHDRSAAGLNKLNAIFYLVQGLGIAAFWTFLVSTGGMDFERTGVIESVFHLASEGLLAAACIRTSVSILRRSSRAGRWYFLCAGLFLSSVGAAAFFYLSDPVEGNAAMVALFGALGLAAVVLLGLSVRSYIPQTPGGLRQSAFLFAGGLLVYAILNVCGLLIGGPGANPGQIFALMAGAAILSAGLLSIISQR